MKYDHKAAKKAKLATMNAKKLTWRSKKKKKTIVENLMKLDDTSDSEVALDSLGQFFNNLIDIDPYQDDTGASQAGGNIGNCHFLRLRALTKIQSSTSDP